MKKRMMVTILLSLFMVFSIIGTAPASPLLFDRGLPTANLNNTAGSSRSNVAWADSEKTGDASPYWLVGDDFTIGTSGSYKIDTIRVWTIKYQDNLSLWTGKEGGTISTIGTNPTVTSVAYSNSEQYQGSSGSFIELYQVDFNNLNWIIAAGEKYQFFIDGPFYNERPGTEYPYINTYLHASNAALSGSTQEGADDLTLWLTMDTNSWPNGVPGTVDTWDSNGGWDKTSDFNVQVYGSPVPLPPAVLLLGSGLLGMVGLGWRRSRKES